MTCSHTGFSDTSAAFVSYKTRRPASRVRQRIYSGLKCRSLETANQIGNSLERLNALMMDSGFILTMKRRAQKMLTTSSGSERGLGPEPLLRRRLPARHFGPP